MYNAYPVQPDHRCYRCSVPNPVRTPDTLTFSRARAAQEQQEPELARGEFLQVQIQLGIRGERYRLSGQRGLSVSYGHGSPRRGCAAIREILRLLVIITWIPCS